MLLLTTDRKLSMASQMTSFDLESPCKVKVKVT